MDNKMKIILQEDDPRYYSEGEEAFLQNCGSFSYIIHNLNKSLRKLGHGAKNESEADIVGFASGLKLDFGFSNKNRFLIHVWETNVLPEFFLNFRRSTPNYTFFGLSDQITNVWNSYGFPTETLDLGVDTEFWKEDKSVEKFPEFTITSVTSCNFRSGIISLIDAFKIFCDNKKIKAKLIIKNTDDRDEGIKKIIKDCIDYFGLNIEYVRERQSSSQIRELYRKSHVLVYTPNNTSGGIPILECGACQTPVIVSDYCPTNLYPNAGKVKCMQLSLREFRQFYSKCNLPYTFPEGWVNEDEAKMYIPDCFDLANHLIDVHNYYQNYEEKSISIAQDLKENWNWDNTAKKLIEYYAKI